MEKVVRSTVHSPQQCKFVVDSLWIMERSLGKFQILDSKFQIQDWVEIGLFGLARAGCARWSMGIRFRARKREDRGRFPVARGHGFDLSQASAALQPGLLYYALSA
jgi:hypothetical protein